MLLPLAVIGLAAARRRLPAAVPLFVGSYAAVLVLVFVTSRYRAPLWPLLTLAAVAGAMELGRGLMAWYRSQREARSWRQARQGAGRGPLLLACLAGLVVVSTAFGPFAPERVELRAELWHGLGFNQLRRDEPHLAAASFRRALAVRRDYPEALNRLGVALARQDSFAAAIPFFERAVALASDYDEAGRNLELARKLARLLE